MRYEPDLLTFQNGAPVRTATEMDARRPELLEILKEHVYGDLPPAAPAEAAFTRAEERVCSGNAALYETEVRCALPAGVFRFPLRLFLPNGGGKKPLLLLINFDPSPWCKYVPVEEITDNGFALAYLYYQDITSDDADFSNGLAALLPRTGSGREPGKIGMWAWGLSRALDVLLARGDLDAERVGVIGHSRLGKTALWCAANDERVKYVCSNDSGCMGAAYNRTRHEGGETFGVIARVFPYWFCENFQKYKETPAEALPFDQHFLIACAAPRRVLVNSAALDLWADPASEQFACAAASPAWEIRGLPGYTGGEKPYAPDEGSPYGDVAYYKRRGVHFLGRKDWQNFMAFMLR